VADERVLAWAVAAGEGLVAFMVTWIVAARLTALAWAQPGAAQVAMGIAAVVGTTVVVVESRRRLAQVRHRGPS
jgi:hypothetical protein